jgi:hypothetical protein
MSTKGFIPFLVAMMLLTGVCNTLLTKYQVCLLGSDWSRNHC